MGNVLIIGGTRGLGYELAKLFAATETVTVVGREEPDQLDHGINFEYLDLNEPMWIPSFVYNNLKFTVNTLVMAAGFAQFGRLHSLSADKIERMVRVGFFSPMFLVKMLLQKQGSVMSDYLQITSTSQWTPRANEPVYAAAKAGIGMFAESMAGDPNIGRVMVAGPSGMKTAFWNGLETDTSQFLEPAEVALAIYDDWQVYRDYQFRQIAILRGPLRVEVRKQT